MVGSHSSLEIEGAGETRKMRDGTWPLISLRIENFQLVTKREISGNLSGRIIESPGQNIRFGKSSELCRNRSRQLVSVPGDRPQIDRISDACATITPATMNEKQPLQKAELGDGIIRSRCCLDPPTTRHAITKAAQKIYSRLKDWKAVPWTSLYTLVR
jgi:hypothetical protein